MLVCELQHVLGTIHINVEDQVRIEYVVLDADNRSEVIDQIDTGNQLVQDSLIEDAVLRDMQARVAKPMLQFCRRPLVENERLISAVKKRVDEMCPKEARPPGDEDSHTHSPSSC